MKNDIVDIRLLVPGSEEWKSYAPIEKGWSSDRKYRIETQRGESLLLRLSDMTRLEAKRREFEMIRKFGETGIPMSRAISFGECSDGKSLYMILEWVEGEDLESVLPTLTEEEQYRLGLLAGRTLKTLHSIPLDEKDIPLETKKEKKLRQLEAYEKSRVRMEGDESVIAFVRESVDAIWKEKPCYLHGDFHPGNLIYRHDGTVGVIDFNRFEIGDPYEEFYKLESFALDVSVAFARGEIDGYFDPNPPLSFWKALAFYSSHASLYSIAWAESFGEKEVEGMRKRYLRTCENYEGFSRLIPKWY